MSRRKVGVTELETILLQAARTRPTTACVRAVKIGLRTSPTGDGRSEWFVSNFERDGRDHGADDAGVMQELEDISRLLRQAYDLDEPDPPKVRSPLL